MAAVVASVLASVLGTFFPMTPPMAPPSGYQTPPVPPVTMLNESLSPAATAPGMSRAARMRTRAICRVRHVIFHLRNGVEPTVSPHKTQDAPCSRLPEIFDASSRSCLSGTLSLRLPKREDMSGDDRGTDRRGRESPESRFKRVENHDTGEYDEYYPLHETERAAEVSHDADGEQEEGDRAGDGRQEEAGKGRADDEQVRPLRGGREKEGDEKRRQRIFPGL